MANSKTEVDPNTWAQHMALGERPDEATRQGARELLAGPAVQHAPLVCSVCAYKMDASSGPANRAPTTGDLTMCMRCTSVLIVGQDGTTLEPLTPAEYAKVCEEQRKQLELIARAHEHIPRTEHMMLDTLVTRAPDDWRAAVTMKNGHFVVSGPFNTRKKAQKALRSARRGVMMALKFADIQDVPMPHQGWYGQAYLTIFGREDPIMQHVGPYLSEREAMRETLARARKLAEVMGVKISQELLIDARAGKPNPN